MTLEQYLRDVLANNSSPSPAFRVYLSESTGQEVVIQFMPDYNLNANPKSFRTSGNFIDEKIYTKD